MLRWLKNKSRNIPTGVYSGANSVTSSDYKYGFHTSFVKVPASATKELPKDCQLPPVPNCKPILSSISCEHIYEDIEDQVSQAVPYSITSLDDLIDPKCCENPLGKVYFTQPLSTCQSSDSGLDSRQSVTDDAVSTTSSSYQPVSVCPQPTTDNASTSCYQPVTIQTQSTKPNDSRQKKKKLIKIKSKASSILRVRKCKRWISNHFTNSAKPRQDSSDEELPPVQVTKRRYESTRQFTRRRIALKKIEDHWFDSDDDSSVISEDSFYSQMDISELCQEPIISATSESTVQCENDSDSGRSSLPMSSSSPSEQLQDESSKEDHTFSEEEQDLPSFNPRIGFGLNRWYRQ